MKLFYAKGACSLAVRIIIHEIGVACDFEAVDLKAKVTENNINYLTINPKEVVPALALDDQVVLTENLAIQQYLAEHYQARELLPATTDFRRYRVLEWLTYVSTELHKGFSPLFNPNIPQTIKEQIFIPALKNKLDFLDKNLQQKNYLMGEDFTLPDAYLFVVLRWLSGFNIPISQWPQLERYWLNLKTRKSIQKSLVEEGIALTNQIT